ncbi:hypothetical protein A2U01_0088656, partial [Trifolium medium]|nr:hypothetical protein [Trifolium medium]
MKVGFLLAIACRAGKDGASRQQVERIDGELLSSARRAGEDGASRSQLGPVARCAASSGASRVFKVHHARRAG